MNAIRSSLAPTAVALLLVVWMCPDAWAVEGVEPSSQSRLIAARLVARYEQSVEPLLIAYCHSCHGSDTQEAGVRIDVLDANMIQGADAEHWSAALDMINQGEMPPDYDSQPSDEERRRIVDWLTDSLDSARKFGRSKPAPQVRRLTREQYTNSLAEILHLPIDFGRNLPAEAKSLSGFTNSGSSLFTSALHADYYQSIARAALDKAIVTGERPQISRYRVTIGKGIGRGHRAARIGGFQSAPIPPRDILVEVLDGQGEPVIPRSVQESQRLREIEANIGIGMRGSSSDRYRIVEEGMVLYSALPHKEQAPKSWQGPSPNLKMLLRRCFPTEGPFKTRVVASLADTKHYQTPTNGLIELRSEMPVARLQGSTSELMAEPDAVVLKAAECRDTHGMVQSGDHLVPSDITKPAVAKFEFTVAKDGYYQIELVHPAAAPDAMPSVSLHVDDSAQHLRLKPSTVPADGVILTPITHARLPAGRRQLEVGGRFFVGFREIVVSPLPEHHPASSSLRSEAGEVAGLQASLRAFLGNRTDDGMEYAEYDTPRTVDAPPGSPGVYEFSGYLDDLPAPLLDEREKTSLSNIMIVGVWNDCLVKDPADDGRPILVKSIEFEAPFYAAWPPKSHSAILFDSPLRETDEDAYTREVIARFMARAFRREASGDEIDRYYQYWTECRTSSGSYVESVKDVLTAVLCSPHFLYLSTPERFQHGDAALAERLSYFLWNSPPDEELNQAAAAGELVETLPEQVRRMIADPRVMNFVNTFATEWLRLDRHLAMSVNVDRYPDYTRFVKRDMALETTHFVRHVLQNNLSLLTFVDSDFAMLNQNLAEFYGIKGVFGGEFRAVAVQPELRRGGLVSQGAFLTGHSDGSQAHPIKRAVWLKSELLNSPPPPPPPNVPELNPETPGFQNLTLKQQLELHRDKASCADCHRKIDPFGVALENYDAVGRHQVSSQKRPIDSTSKLPDGTLVSGVDELKAYLLDNRREDVARSVVAHLLAYALGRDLTFADDPLLERVLDEVASDDYRLQTAVQAIVKSVEFSSQSLSVR